MSKPVKWRSEGSASGSGKFSSQPNLAGGRNRSCRWWCWTWVWCCILCPSWYAPVHPWFLEHLCFSCIPPPDALQYSALCLQTLQTLYLHHRIIQDCMYTKCISKAIRLSKRVTFIKKKNKDRQREIKMQKNFKWQLFSCRNNQGVLQNC